MRARAVALTGDDLGLLYGTPPRQSAAVPYLRFEGIPSPEIVARDRLSDRRGESIDVLVYRDFAPTGAVDRHIGPPRASLALAECHGAFDRDGRPRVDAYEEIRNRDEHGASQNDQDIAYPDSHLDVPWLPDPIAAGFVVRGLPGLSGPQKFWYGDGGGVMRRKAWRVRLASGPLSA